MNLTKSTKHFALSAVNKTENDIFMDTTYINVEDPNRKYLLEHPKYGNYLALTADENTFFVLEYHSRKHIY